MPLFHAAFSFGTLAGSVGAAVAAGQGLSPTRHFVILAMICGGVTVGIARWIPVEELLTVPAQSGRAERAPFRRLALWLLGGVALCASIAEGATADWSALFGVQERGLSEATGALIYSCFSITMACTRLCGEAIQRRWGAPRMLIGGAAIGGLGLATAVMAPSPALTFAGFAVAGVGLAYASPVVMELSGAAGRRADGGGGEREVAFATTIAYTGFLLGPPMVGGIAELTNLPVALGAVAVLVLLIGPLTLAAGTFPTPGVVVGRGVGGEPRPGHSDPAQNGLRPPPPRPGGDHRPAAQVRCRLPRDVGRHRPPPGQPRPRRTRPAGPRGLRRHQHPYS
ncbi:hypothetical protein SALBM311S_01159 [Streptomyces alboniger]